MKANGGNIGYGEEELVGAFKSGSEQAFSLIFQWYFPTLYQYSVQFLKSEDDAEDVVQEAFIRLWQYRKNLTSESSIKALLFITTRNLLITRFKKKLNAPAFVDFLEYCNSIGEEDASGVEYQEFLDRLSGIIDELPPQQSRVVRMSKLDQLTNKEIAEELGINEQSVKNNLSIGLKYVRRRLLIPILIFVSSMLNFC